jgi:Fe-S oxidoreductase
MCRHVCTSGNISSHESDYPRGRGLILDKILEGRLEYGVDLVQAVYNCCLCGLCWSNCEGGYMPHQLILSSREDIADKGMAPAAVSGIIKKIESGKNPYGRSSKIYQGDERKADTLYYMGDYIKFNSPLVADSVVNILKRAGSDYAILKDEPTDGKIMTLLGFTEKARDAAQRLSKRIMDITPETILVSDPLSYDCLKNDFPAYGLSLKPEVVHISEYIAGLIDKKKIKVKKADVKVTLADSEFLGRYNLVFEPPRKVIKAVAGSGFKEMIKNREKALATGEAAFLFNGSLKVMGKMIGSRLCRAAQDVDAGTIVTLSGIAKENIKDCGNRDVFEISEFIWQNIK